MSFSVLLHELFELRSLRVSCWVVTCKELVILVARLSFVRGPLLCHCMQSRHTSYRASYRASTRARITRLTFSRKFRYYSAFTETGATGTMKTNQMAELKQISVFNFWRRKKFAPTCWNKRKWGAWSLSSNQKVTDWNIRHKIYISQLSKHVRVKIFADFSWMLYPLYSNSWFSAHNWTSSFARLAFVLLLKPVAFEEDFLAEAISSLCCQLPDSWYES